MELVSVILSFLGGTGLMSIFLIREKRKAAKLDNAEKIIEMYKEITLEWKKLVCYNLSCENRTPAKCETENCMSCEVDK